MGMEYFGDKLKALRTGKGYTQAVLAKKVGIVTGTVSAYEQGLKYPSVEVLVKLCEALDSSADYLLSLDDGMPLRMAGLTDAQMQNFMALIAIVERYNGLTEK